MSSFDAEILRHAARKGLLRDADGKWARSPTFVGSSPLCDDEIRYLNERDRHREQDVRLECQWVENFAQYAEALAREGTAAAPAYGALFWLRLYGVTSELLPKRSSFFRSIGVDPASQVARPGSPLAFALETFRGMVTLRKVFTDDELIYADYRRHVEAHPTQGAYSVRLSKKRAILERHGIPALNGREFTVAELNQAIERVLHAHRSEHAIAVAFARRAVSSLPALFVAARRGAGR